MSHAVNAYFEQIQQKLGQLAAAQAVIDRAAAAMADTVQQGRNLFVFGASHAG
ncbi:MAG TPA: hypothetical protein DCM53_12900, partial [Enterobacteriaceae bacterium]|nr:hypothetical protein [Enterobacteriaceae bacterium]